MGHHQQNKSGQSNNCPLWVREARPERAVVLSMCHRSTLNVLSPLLQVFRDAQAVFAAAGAVVLAAEPAVAEVSALVSEEPELSPEVAVVAAESAAVSVAGIAVAELFAAAELSPEVVVAVDIAGTRAFDDTAPVSNFSDPVSDAEGGVDNPRRPRFFAVANSHCCAKCSSSVEVVGQEFDHSPTGTRANSVPCNIVANSDPHRDRTLEHGYSNPSPGCSSVSDTSDLPTNATTNRSRRTGLWPGQEPRRHRPCRASLSPREVPRRQWAEADQY
jgi:hypothetical protein